MNKKIIKQCNKILAISMLTMPIVGLSNQSTTVKASINSQPTVSLNEGSTPNNVNVIKLIKSLSPSAEAIANQHIEIKNNNFILDNNAIISLSSTDITKIRKILTIFNQTVNSNYIILSSEKDNNTNDYSQYMYPFISLARSKKQHHYKKHIVGYGSNGYCYQDSKGNFHYVVTKTPLQTVASVMYHGWMNAAGSGFGLGLYR
ncbi:MAG: garvicin Q family class II bacteriocin [Lactobacillus iners]|jgi:hypothetical protein|uniref:garvicin Q family class II bacteriocin n=1 Tax=Lactobacillus iners TaxID=147802 RepID=UPI001F098699|nr:garvicin Q family class II bacteriocin [Lactobacillus iners]MCT7675646.1 garvicin Q family class II bacteriocin [Lactobacillus iners]MCT7737343.1 garvicin Q family class II bacteriocin [Lactobacillus iners]MCT7809304.1 garvicin Q family class II bacteriocin [Lactobacillus iners]MCT7833149.1 garvicin Q family class II bacteriocin [Lactobacillus iners]MCT7838444.1 garvicin Q family class II bacteriocin [Lactobacillus iners]